MLFDSFSSFLSSSAIFLEWFILLTNSALFSAFTFSAFSALILASTIYLLSIYSLMFYYFRKFSDWISISFYLSACFSWNFYSSLNRLIYRIYSFLSACSSILYSSSFSFWDYLDLISFNNSFPLLTSSWFLICFNLLSLAASSSFSRASYTLIFNNSPSIFSSCIFLMNLFCSFKY